MNLQLHHVISDIVGQTGLAIVDAILAGQRDPLKLAKLRNQRIQASEEVIAKSLVGDYRPEHLFTLRQSLTAYRSYQELLEECGREIEVRLQHFNCPDASGELPVENSKASTKKRVRRRPLAHRAQTRLRYRPYQDPRHSLRHCADTVWRGRTRFH
jgi:hypothetical protein